MIRYLTKVFQYDLAIRSDDLPAIRKIIEQYDPNAPVSSYVTDWIEKNGKKLVQSAVNLEYAFNTLDQLGLRTKLKARGDQRMGDTLAWWMNREPLKSAPLGTRGRTAREIFEDKHWIRPGAPLVVAHETANLSAYDSITRAHTGDPNVLISRANQVGENAVHGDGFYTHASTWGTRNTGINIRFSVSPDAREGVDFYLGKGDAQVYVIFLNKQALRVIPESLNMDPVDYFKMLAARNAPLSLHLPIQEKLRRRIASKGSAIPPEDAVKILEIVRKGSPASPLRSEWLALPVSARYPEDALAFLHGADGAWDLKSVKNALSHPHWTENEVLLPALSELRLPEMDALLLEPLLKSPVWPRNSGGCGILLRLLENRDARLKFVRAPGAPAWASSPCSTKIIEKFRIHESPAVLIDLFSHPAWTERPEAHAILLKLVAEGGHDPEISSQVLLHPYWEKQADGVKMFRTILDRIPPGDRHRTQAVLKTPMRNGSWIAHPDFPDLLQKIQNSDNFALYEYLTHPKWGEIPEAMKILERDILRGPGTVFDSVFSREGWEKLPQPIQKVLDKKNPNLDQQLVLSVLRSERWTRAHPEILTQIMDRGIKATGWKRLRVPGLLEDEFETRREIDRSLVRYVFSDWHWAERPDGIAALKTIIERQTADAEIEKYLLPLIAWREHSELVRLAGGAPVTLKRVREGLARERGCAGLFSRLFR